MEFTYEIFEYEDGYGYKILQNGVPFIVQDFKPYVENFVYMTREEAEKYAQETVKFFEDLYRSSQTENQ